MPSPDEELLHYYWQELLYLRREGEQFARAYPKVAARLELSADGSPDPHVERLIESFAFLTARIQRNLDNDFPEIAAELVQLLYPHLVQPVPSMSVARLRVDPKRGKPTFGHQVPRETGLFVHSEDGTLCRFRTCYPVTLWPLEISEAALEPAERYPALDWLSGVSTVLRLRLATLADPLDTLELDRLRLYLHGDAHLVGRLYELICQRALGVAVLAPGARRADLLAQGSIEPVGFALDEEVLPHPRQAQPAYRLLQEYFTLPEKFHFFDLTGLAQHLTGEAVDLLFLLERSPEPRLHVEANNFLLGCTPIINLFSHTSEPIRIDHRSFEYRLVGDQRRERTTEVHSILKVTGTADSAAGSREIEPFYSFNHGLGAAGQRVFWHGRRVPCQVPGLTGSDLLLSFLDLDFKPSLPPMEVVFAHVLCTNRALAEQVPAGCLLETDVPMPVGQVVCLKKPTQQHSPPLGGQTLWRLVSHLSLNYLSFTSEAESLKALRELLRLYCPAEAAAAHRQIDGLMGLSVEPVVRRVGNQAWKGFCRGHEVTLTLDEGQFVGGSAFLFAGVLSRFFALYCSTNSFTQLVAKSREREGEWYRWPPMAGEKRLL
ncbi:MAG TPA: type VI secretion system baseplate subunit TssF [Thermoanaerobaculia bacterium]|nr:type VI secretion system baseplate subunit TssF [Thermoanaerobaculia bacterium]